jgi:hypothetical protein
MRFTYNSDSASEQLAQTLLVIALEEFLEKHRHIQNALGGTVVRSLIRAAQQS